MIPIIKPFLPPQEEFESYLAGIWKRQWLTNMGPLATELEQKLSKHLKTEHLLFTTNGTVALQMAIKALNLEGEIITTPFSFVATTSSIFWENCTPIFVDIDPNSLNIDPSKIEAKISNKTSAILATHVYGNPCDVEKIEKIAQKHNLKVIYDGAHAFGVELNGKSIFEYGDISICSLHATKLYHSIEGGLIITKNKDLQKKLMSMRNFGFSSFVSFSELGINGKNSEFHAAMGLCNLKYIEQIHLKRKALTEHYNLNLKKLKHQKQVWRKDATFNYAYYPILLENEDILKKHIHALELNEIFTRRYYYPSLANSLPYLEKQKIEVTDDISSRILCLPLYHDLSIEEVELICKIMLETQSNL